MARDTEFSLNFLLLSMDVAVPTLDPMVPVPTLGDVILDKLYNDETHEDVLFIFNPPSDIMTTANKSGVAFDVVSHSNVDANKSAEYARTPAEDPSTPNKPNDNASKIDHDTDRSKWKAFSTGYSTDDTTGVYKLALCQWPHTDASWESLYLLAHRYDIQELVDYVPNAYLFPDFREPVVKYVAQSCRSTLASKSARAKNLDHPESAELFGDLLEQMYVINR
ncbi:hypothetical protein BG003_000235 [Podila horticola]|nr:hypothetical protein BG003_000235 [Podila horticola]